MNAEEVAKAISIPLERWHGQCHTVSLAIVKKKLFGPSRVARGTCEGVGSQHSWVVLSARPGSMYEKSTPLLDPTLWTYRDDVEGLFFGTCASKWHTPKGAGDLWAFGCPQSPGGEELIPKEPITGSATSFLRFLKTTAGTLSYGFWMRFFSQCPMANPPILRDLIDACYRDERIRGAIPVDIVGMLTDHNPSGLYLAD